MECLFTNVQMAVWNFLIVSILWKHESRQKNNHAENIRNESETNPGLPNASGRIPLKCYKNKFTVPFFLLQYEKVIKKN